MYIHVYICVNLQVIEISFCHFYEENTTKLYILLNCLNIDSNKILILNWFQAKEQIEMNEIYKQM